jgi:hypothetical protein
MKIVIYQGSDALWRVRFYLNGRIIAEGTKSFVRLGPAVKQARAIAENLIEIVVQSGDQKIEDNT